MEGEERTETIRHLNDDLRSHGLNGNIFITRGVANLGSETVQLVFKAIAEL